MKVCKDLFLVILLEKVYVFTFSNMECLEQIETNKNQYGLAAISAVEQLSVIVCPHPD